MRLSLDTHIVIWWFENPEQLKESVIALIEDSANDVYVSSAVLWEISIKSAMGKLRLPANFISLLKKDFIELPILWKHTIELENLERLHQDPFDRLLIAQSKSENLTFVTKDKNILKYSFNVIKA